MARLGEDLGFDLVGIADTPVNAMDPWVALTLAAAATTRVRLAMCVTNLVSRHPAATAAAAASVELVAPGRVVLGVGAGHSGATSVGGAPARPAELQPAARRLGETYTTRQGEMDPGLGRRLGLFDYLRRRLAIAGTPADCIEQVRAARQAGVRRLMFTVSLASDPVRTVELFGRKVLPLTRPSR